MKKYFFAQAKSALMCSVFFTLACSHSLYSVQTPKDKINEWVKSCPWIGLVANEVTCGPITLKDLDLDKKGRFVIALPGEEINASVKYSVDADRLESWNLHHIAVGIKGQDDPICITHSFGVWDKNGKACFTLKAPEKKGVYEVRFDYQEAMLCSDAAKAWRKNNPSAKATVGIIIVDNS